MSRIQRCSVPLEESTVSVREYSVPALVEADPARNLTDLITENAAEAPDTVVFSRPAAGAGRTSPPGSS